MSSRNFPAGKFRNAPRDAGPGDASELTSPKTFLQESFSPQRSDENEEGAMQPLQ